MYWTKPINIVYNCDNENKGDNSHDSNFQNIIRANVQMTAFGNY
ncbi:MAG: hypothetical protein UFA98_04370 [Ruminococcus sp.]|nr:hypothetical protein [Ruminococcus sp.]